MFIRFVIILCYLFMHSRRYDSFRLFIPQVITPNGDGKNDVFAIKAYDNIDGLEIEIFNRWGDVVYKKTEYKNDFDGTNNFGEQLAEDTYFYILKTPGDKTYKGYVEIKRK